MMSSEFEMSMMGELNFFLGLQIKQTSNGTLIHQQKYIKELLKKFGMDSSKPIDTPISPSTKLVIDNGSPSAEDKLHRGMIGSLLYLTASRPDIVFSVGLCARFQSNPKETHLKDVKRMLRHLKHTSDLALWYPKGCNFDLVGDVNADYAGFLIDRKITSGMAHFLGPCLVSWATKKQHSVAISTTEARLHPTSRRRSRLDGLLQSPTQVRPSALLYQVPGLKPFLPWQFPQICLNF